MSVFDYIKSINKSEYMHDLDEYVPFVVNMAFSLYDDTIFQANKVNINYNLTKKQQYDYLFHSIRKKHRYTPWPKKPEKNEDLLCVSQYYKYNMRRSKEALKILSSPQIKIIKEKTDYGGA